MRPRNEAETTMRTRILLPALLALAIAGCDSILTTSPVNEVGDDQAIVDAAGAAAARAGAYSALESGNSYGQYLLTYADLPTEDVEHSGTFSWFAEWGSRNFKSDNQGVNAVWDGIYLAMARANVLLARLPNVEGLDQATLNEYLGEAHFLRALDLHNAVKFWGDVPMPLAPAASVQDAAEIARTPKAQVYQQILDDLSQASQLISNATQTRKASLGAVQALKSRVLLFMEDWQGVVDAANATEAFGYTLAPNYADLFDANGADTPEDIFRVDFTLQQSNSMGTYYRARSSGGRAEVQPTKVLYAAYEPGDVRRDWSLTFQTRGGGTYFGSKWPTGSGAEDIHVIRFAEVLLNRAEALAHLGRLQEAVADYNRVRERAGLAPHVLGVDVSTQQEVLAAVWHERRVELAMEGFRWPDLVRTGRAQAVLGVQAYQLLWPIPQAELDVAPNLTQNPGY